MSQSDIISSNVDRPYQDLGDHTVVLMATYNGAAFLEEQLRSLRDQTDAKCVLITRDDHSTDSMTDGPVTVLCRSFAAQYVIKGAA